MGRSENLFDEESYLQRVVYPEAERTRKIVEVYREALERISRLDGSCPEKDDWRGPGIARTALAEAGRLT